MAPLPYIKSKFRNGPYSYVNISKGKAADDIILSESRVLVELSGFMEGHKAVISEHWDLAP